MPQLKPSESDESAQPAASVVRGWITMFCGSLALYALTCSRHIQWQDSGYHILRVVTGEIVNPMGLALSHPLHQWLARGLVQVLPLEPAFAVTLLSSIAAAVTVANIYGCVMLLTGKRTAAAWAAASLAVANVFWHLGTIAETYTLAAALLSAECWCLAAFVRSRRPSALAGLMLFNGLGVANHMLAILTTPVIAGVVVYAIRHDWTRWRRVLLPIACWLIGASTYLSLIVAEAIQSGNCVDTLHSALFGRAFAEDVLNTTLPLRSLAVSVAFLMLSFPNLLLPASVLGISRGTATGIPRVTRRALLAALGIHLVFAARYAVIDQYMFFCPAYVLLALFGGIGAAYHMEKPNARTGAMAAIVLLFATPLVSALTPALASRSTLVRRMLHNKPYRDDYVYLFTPWAVVEDSADKLSRHAIELAGENGLILIEDGMARFAVRYQALRANRHRLDITTDITRGAIIDAARAGRPVVLVPADRDAPRTEPPLGTWRRNGDLYVLDVPKKVSG